MQSRVHVQNFYEQNALSRQRTTYTSHNQKTMSSSSSFLQPTTWSKVSDFTQSLLGPKCLDLKHSVFFGAQIVQAQSSDIHEFIHDKLVTLKVDGERHLVILYIDGPQKDVRVLAMRRNGQILEAPLGTASLRTSSPLASKPHGFFTILDCEFLAEQNVWLAFDCIVFRAIPKTVQHDFLVRYDLIGRTLAEDFACENIIIKPYMEVRTGIPDFTQWVRTETEQKLNIRLEDDGLVFQPKHGPYPVGKNMNLATGRGLKWKPECTLDLVPRPMTAREVQTIHEQLYGPVKRVAELQVRSMYSLGLIRAAPWLWSVRGGSTKHTFKLARPLYKLDCVSDFSVGTHVHYTTLALKYGSVQELPVCVELNHDEQQPPVLEFEIDTTTDVMIPVLRTARADKATYQANKARTVAGVLWQADENRKNHYTIDDYLLDTSRIPPEVRLNPPEFVHPVDNPSSLIPLDDYIGRLDFSGTSEHEFKVVQTKRPRAGNIFPATLERNFMNGSFVDVMHFERVVQGLSKRFQKPEPPVVTTIDMIFEGGLRLTAHERGVMTKSGQTLNFYETDGFYAVRKTHDTSVVVKDDTLLNTSGYCYRLDTRKETPELFVDHTFLPENSTYLDFLLALQESIKNPRKRKGAAANNAFNPDAYKGYRLVDRQDFAKEVEREVDVSRLRRVSAQPVQVGEVMQVEYRGRPGQFHMATVTRVDPSGTKVDVQYDYAVKSLTSYTSTRHIPLVVDPNGLPAGTVALRVKKRRTFEFPGFRVDLTQTKFVQDFRSSERTRLHHLPHHANHCEIEIEMLSSIQRNPSFRDTLKEVMTAVWTCMRLSENRFLFDRVVENPPTPALQAALDAFTEHVGGIINVKKIDAVFLRAVSGVARIVPETDFYSTFDAAADAALGPVVPISDPNMYVPPTLDISRLGPFVDTTQTVVDDYVRRRVWRSVRAAGEDGEMHGLMRGIINVGMNPSWKDDAFWTLLKKRLDMNVVVDDFDVEQVTVLINYLRSTSNEPLEESPFLNAGFAFGEAAARHIYVNQGIRAWWDPQEATLAWNDLLDYTTRYAVEVTRDVTFDQWMAAADGEEDDAFMYPVVARALAKLSVLVGAVRMIRNVDEVPQELITLPLKDMMVLPERRVYIQSYNPFEFKDLEGIECTHVF